jgi:D-threonate/D-erythronate kinase
VARLRLLADDLTGALDAAAQFVPLTGPVAVPLDDRAVAADAAAIAFDSASRELSEDAAAWRIAVLAPLLATPGIAFKKLDSLLRGHVAAELAACLATREFAHCIIAPAFPAQRRVTRNGHQFAWDAGRATWGEVPVDLRGELAHRGYRLTLARPGDPLPAGVSLWDAKDDDDLAAIVAAGRAAATSVLWCGSAGLAGALAGGAPPPAPALAHPIVACIGSNHPAMELQLAAIDERCRVTLRDGTDRGTARAAIGERLVRHGAAAVTVALPTGLDRASAARRIDAAFAELVRELPRPATLLASGGETLRAIALALGAVRLDVAGQLLPGIPYSVLRGGRWDGLSVVSKSGAFGDRLLLTNLLGLLPDRK